MKTPVCEMLGIEFPIFAFTHCRDVAAAVSKAGGIGVLGATAHTPEQLEIDLTWMEEQIGDKPYGVDLLIPAKYVGADEGTVDVGALESLIPAGHRTFLDDMMRRYEVPEKAAGDEPSHRPATLGISPDTYAPLLDVAFAHKTKLIASALGSPPAWLIDRAHAQDVYVAALAGKSRHAEKHKANGVDIIVAQGTEAGGHTGDITTMVLIPQIVDAVAPMPVVAAGGIANGRQMAAALALGAQGVWCGSVWLTTEEAETHPVVRDKFLAAGSSDTLRSRSKTGKPARQLRSAWTDEWEDPKNPDPLGMPLQSMLIAPFEERISRAAHRKDSGAEQLVNYFVGQVVGQMNEVKKSEQVVFEMVNEMIDATDRLQRVLEI